MTTYVIKTDADEMAVEATSFDDAARQYCEARAEARWLLHAIAKVDGAWAWIENVDTGERIGGHTPGALADYLERTTSA